MIFFFNLRVNGSASSDAIGTEFDTFGRMQREAVHALLTIAAEEATEVDRQKFEVVVRDSVGPVYRVSVMIESGLVHPNS